MRFEIWFLLSKSRWIVCARVCVRACSDFAGRWTTLQKRLIRHMQLTPWGFGTHTSRIPYKAGHKDVWVDEAEDKGHQTPAALGARNARDRQPRYPSAVLQARFPLLLACGRRPKDGSVSAADKAAQGKTRHRVETENLAAAAQKRGLWPTRMGITLTIWCSTQPIISRSSRCPNSPMCSTLCIHLRSRLGISVFLRFKATIRSRFGLLSSLLCPIALPVNTRFGRVRDAAYRCF